MARSSRLNLTGARPPLPPPIPKRNPSSPPPLPPAALRNGAVLPSGSLPPISHRVSYPVKALTVDNLVKAFSEQKLEEAVSLLMNETGGKYYSRPASLLGGPGALIQHNSQRKAAILGDLHGNEPRLDLVLEKMGPLLASGEAELWLLGDIIHPEKADRLDDMASSLRVLKAVVMLKTLFPDRVHVCMGNHDILFTRAEVLDAVVEHRMRYPEQGVKAAAAYIIKHAGYQDADGPMYVGKKRGKEMVLQGLPFLHALCDELGKEGRDEAQIRAAMGKFQQFFDGLPLAIISHNKDHAVYMAHSAVVRGGVTQAELVEARHDKDLMQQLLYNKAVDGDYAAADVERTQQKLGLTRDPKKTFVISGHVPAPDGENWGYRPFADKNHVIIHGNISSHFGLLLLENGKVREGNLPVVGTPYEAAA